MKKSLVLALTAGFGGIAAAQPGPPPQPPPPPVDTTGGGGTAPDPGPPNPNPTPTPEPAPRPAPMIHEDPAPSGDRPEGLSFALGVGYGLPTSLQTPNRTSFRVRLASGLTFEPFVAISNTSEDMETPTMQTTNKETDFGLGVLSRLPMITHNRVDFEVLADLGFNNNKNNPE